MDQRTLTHYVYQIIAFSTFGSITYGYCSSIIGTTLGQPSFQKYFALDTRSNATQLEGAINGVYQAGGLFGALFAGWIGDRLGRCKAMFVAACFCVVGGALQAGSVHIAMFIVARLISGFGVGMIVMLVPLWQSEVAPPHARGLLVGLHGVSINIGYTSSTWIGVGFYYVDASGAQWRPPLAIQCLAPLILACGILFIPESPRWLIDHGKPEKAREILSRIHQDQGDLDNTFAHDEYTQIKEQLAIEHSLPSSWTSLFTIAHYRKRALIGFLTMFAGQMTGTLVINNYGPELYKSLGFDSANQLIIAGGWITVALPSNLINALFLDKLGRTRFLAIGLTGDVVALLGEIIMLAVFENTNNKGGLAAAVFFLFLHVTFYALCIDASTYVYGSEIWPTHLRAKGLAVSITGLFVGSLILLVSAPTAFAKISWRFYIVMLVCTALFAVVVLLYFPETKGLPLEEISAKFGDEVAVRLTDEACLASDHTRGPAAGAQAWKDEKGTAHEEIEDVIGVSSE